MLNPDDVARFLIDVINADFGKIAFVTLILLSIAFVIHERNTLQRHALELEQMKREQWEDRLVLEAKIAKLQMLIREREKPKRDEQTVQLADDGELLEEYADAT